MNNKIIGFLICIFLIIVTYVPAINASVNTNFKMNMKKDVLTQDKPFYLLLDKILEDLWIKFYDTQNINEKIKVIKNIILRMDTYELLPEDINVKEAQKLVVDAFLYAEKLTTNSQITSFLNNGDIQVYIWAGYEPHPDDPTVSSLGTVLNKGLINNGSEPVEWFESQDFYDISSGTKGWHWPLAIWGFYRGPVEPNDYDMTFSGYFSGESELVKVNVMVDETIFSRWGVYLGFGLYYFPEIGGKENGLSITSGNSLEKVLIDEGYSSFLYNKDFFPENTIEKQTLQFNNLDFESEELTKYNAYNEESFNNMQEKEVIQTMVSDFPWPMYCHDNRHTGRSNYDSLLDYGFEKWHYKINGMVTLSPSIGEDGTIYLGGSCMYAINPDGTIKWKFDPPGGIFDFTCPAIDKNGTLYASTCSAKYTYMYAINPDGTVKWKKSIGNTYSPPTIGDNGIIYFTHKSSDKSYITALNTDGTLEWGRYISNESMLSSPAIGMDGTIYCGSHDCYLYAIKSDGTVKWKFNTGGRVHGSPTLSSDGTIFIGSENGLHALYQNNGSMKWHINLGEIWGGVALDDDGTVYVGVSSGRFYAINPDGTIKLTYYAPGNIWFTSPALSADGIIYFGTLSLGGGTAKLIALNTDGTERWTWKDSNYDYDNFQSAPAIGPDGTVYIASSHWLSGGYCYLHAFGMLDANAPNAPIITGQKNGEPWKEYEYTFKAVDPNNDDLYYYIDWGDGLEEEWIGPYSSGEEVKVSHIWTGPIVYTISAKAKDTGSLFGPWGSFEINMPREKTISNSLLLRFLERYPLLQALLLRLGFH